MDSWSLQPPTHLLLKPIHPTEQILIQSGKVPNGPDDAEGIERVSTNEIWPSEDLKGPGEARNIRQSWA